MSTQNQEVTVEDCPVTVNHDTTVAELKEAVGASPHDVATYFDDQGEIVALSDHDPVQEMVPDDAEISFQPAHGTVFG